MSVKYHIFERLRPTQAEISKEQEHNKGSKQDTHWHRTKDSRRKCNCDNFRTHWDWPEYLLSKNLAFICIIRKNRVEFQRIFTDEKGRECKSTLFGFQRDSMLLSVLRKTVNALLSSVFSQLLTDSKTDVKKQTNNLK